MANAEVTWRDKGGAVEVEAGAGAEWDPIVDAATTQHLAGIECLAGIPGAVGATPIQNVGAYGQEVRETVRRVDALDLETGRVASFSNADCRFGYRESRFKREDAGRYVVLTVLYELERGGSPALRYAELVRYFDVRGIGVPTLSDVRRAVLEIRRGKSMVVDPADPNSRSAGSFFVNPTLDRIGLSALEDIAEKAGAGPVPRFTVDEERVKVPAAWLIERAGFAKGYARGRAAISSRHALALVNRGGATAVEIASLAREIRDGVRDRFGVLLQPEPVLVGLTLDDVPAGGAPDTSPVFDADRRV
jgi:UDP-N-acetylmuramate dehydrogenase